MQIITIPLLSDNYSYLLLEAGLALAIDPGDAAPVLAAVRKAGANLNAILLTHRHNDHTAGCAELRAQTRCAIIGPAECAACGLDRTIGEGDVVALAGLAVRALAVPGHTRGHVAYVCERGPAVWTGDTLFVGGCGRILEGSAAEMWHSLCRLRKLPPETQVHSGHDYTRDNLEFAASVLPHNAAIQARLAEVQVQEAAGQPTGSSSIAVERETNIFLRADSDEVRHAAGIRDPDPVAVFAELRRRKDEW